MSEYATLLAAALKSYCCLVGGYSQVSHVNVTIINILIFVSLQFYNQYSCSYKQVNESMKITNEFMWLKRNLLSENSIKATDWFRTHKIQRFISEKKDKAVIWTKYEHYVLTVQLNVQILLL